MDVKIGVMLPQAEEHLESPEETRTPSEPLEETAYANTLLSDFWPPELEITHFKCFIALFWGLSGCPWNLMYLCSLYHPYHPCSLGNLFYSLIFIYIL